MFKVVRLSELDELGFSFDTLSFALLGKGKFVVIELDSEIGWFPMCGENRFKTKRDADQAIADRIQLNAEIDEFNSLDVEPKLPDLDSLSKALQAGEKDEKN